jgi:hypothetical protein
MLTEMSQKASPNATSLDSQTLKTGEFSTRDVGHMAKNTQTLKSEFRIKFWVSILYLISTIYDIYDDTMLLKEYHMMKKLVIVKKPEASFQERTRGKTEASPIKKKAKFGRKNT